LAALERQHWGVAPATVDLFGRGEQLAQMTRSVTDGEAHLLGALGPGGLGKSTLLRVWGEKVSARFEDIVWLTFKDKTPLQVVLADACRLLDPHEPLPDTADLPTLIDHLTDMLRSRAILLVLDNLESVMEPGPLAGNFEAPWRPLEPFLRRVVDGPLRGVVCVSSREAPKVLADLEHRSRGLLLCHLEGLDRQAAASLLASLGLAGSPEEYEQLRVHHDGNPYALGIVADYLRSDGLRQYLAQGPPLPGEITALLAEQYERLPELGQICVMKLAAERSPLSRQVLANDLQFKWSASEINDALRHPVVRRFLEPSPAGELVLQNLLVEHATTVLIDRLVTGTLESPSSDLDQALVHVPLVRPSADEHVRAAQLTAITTPVLDALHSQIGTRRDVITVLRDRILWASGLAAATVGYAAGTWVNLLVHVGADLTDTDVSKTILWNCVLDDTALRRVNISGSDLTGSSFANVLGVVTDLTFDATGEWLYLVTAEGVVRAWSWEGGLSDLVPAHSGHARAIAADRVRSRVVTAGDDGVVRAWRSGTLTAAGELYGHEGGPSLRCVALNPSCTSIAVGGQAGLLTVIRSDGTGLPTVLSGHRTTVRGLVFLDDDRLISISEDGAVLRWQLGNPQPTHTYELEGRGTSVTTRDGDVFVAGRSGKPVALTEELTESGVDFGESGPPIWQIAAIRDLVCTATSAGTVHAYDRATGRLLRVIPAHSNWARTISPHPTLPLLATGSEDQTVRIFEASSGQSVRRLRGAHQSLWALACDRRAHSIATAGSSTTVYLWRNRALDELVGYPSWIHALALSPDGNRLAVAGHDGDVYVWDLQAPAQGVPIGKHDGPVWSLDFHPNGRLLASAGEDTYVRLWPLAGGPSSGGQSIHQHDSWVVSVKFSPSGNLVASGADDGRLLVSAIDGTNPTWLLDEDARQIWALAWSNTDPDVLFAGGEDGVVRKWRRTEPGGPEALSDPGPRLWSGVCTRDDARVVVVGDRGSILELRSRDLKLAGGPPKQNDARIHAICPLDGNRDYVTAGDDGIVRMWRRRRVASRVWLGHQTRVEEVTPDRLYEGLNLEGATGLSTGQITSLRLLGAVGAAPVRYLVTTEASTSGGPSEEPDMLTQNAEPDQSPSTQVLRVAIAFAVLLIVVAVVYLSLR
jgi:WD40 repeat protein